MANATTTSKKFTLNWRDAARGLIMAVGTPVLYLLQELIPGWEAHPVLKAAISATITYLIKNFISGAEIVLTAPTKSQIEAVEQGAEIKIVK